MRGGAETGKAPGKKGGWRVIEKEKSARGGERGVVAPFCLSWRGMVLRGKEIIPRKRNTESRKEERL